MLGQIGPITGGRAGEVGSPRTRASAPATTSARPGSRRTYNRYLQGKDGVEKVQVDAVRLPDRQGADRSPRRPPGDELQTSLDLGLEREGYIALRRAMAAAQPPRATPATAGAFFAMDPYSGRVLALGSLPTYNPNMFVTPPSYGAVRRSC